MPIYTIWIFACICIVITCWLILYIYGVYYAVPWQYKIWRWTQEHIYPFKKHLLPIEQTYIHKCIELSGREWYLRPLYVHNIPLITRLSFFTYSIRFSVETETGGKKVNPSRFAYGMTLPTPPSQIYPLVQEILEKRGVQLPINFNELTEYYPHIYWNGLGWDFENHTIRIYFIVPQWNKVPSHFIPFNELHDNKHSKHNLTYMEGGLLSWTWNWEKSVMEDEKIYIYCKNKPECFMYSVKRNKWIRQKDSSTLPSWVEKTPIFYSWVEKWQKRKERVDTISYENENSTIVYFPQI